MQSDHYITKLSTMMLEGSEQEFLEQLTPDEIADENLCLQKQVIVTMLIYNFRWLTSSRPTSKKDYNLAGNLILKSVNGAFLN